MNQTIKSKAVFVLVGLAIASTKTLPFPAFSYAQESEIEARRDNAVSKLPKDIETVIVFSRPVVVEKDSPAHLQIAAWSIAQQVPEKFLRDIADNEKLYSADCFIFGSKNHRAPDDTSPFRLGPMHFDGLLLFPFAGEAVGRLDDFLENAEADSSEIIENPNGSKTMQFSRRKVIRGRQHLLLSSQPGYIALATSNEMLTTLVADPDEDLTADRYEQNPDVWQHVPDESIFTSVRQFLEPGEQPDPTSPTNHFDGFVPKDLEAVGEVISITRTDVDGEFRVTLMYVSESRSRRSIARNRWAPIRKVLRDFEVKELDEKTIVGSGTYSAATFDIESENGMRAFVQILTLMGHAVFL